MLTELRLPQAPAAPAERADAARNRERILCAAQRLFAEHGAACVSMDAVADAAGVGKGTLFRRFGSRAALASAVLDEQERAFQERMIRGAPPLGPGAPARDRLVAFGEEMLETLETHSELLAAAELGGERFSGAPFAAHRLHVTVLLREADPQADAHLLAETLLATLGAELFIHLRESRGLELERLKQSWRDLIWRLLPAPAAGRCS